MLFSILDKLLVSDCVDLRDALREAVTQADAPFAGLSIENHCVEYAGEFEFAPAHVVVPTRSVPEVMRIATSHHGMKHAAVLRVRLDRFHRPMVLMVVGHEMPDVIAIDAVEQANLRIERILASVADRHA